MPPQAKITREMILDAAFDLARTEGWEALTVRRLAAALGCSTQPILYQFDSIGQIVEAAYRRADDFHTAFLTGGLEAEVDPMMALGLRYIRFGAEEKPLFRFLFQSGRFSGKTLEDMTSAPDVAPLVEIVCRSAGIGPEDAAQAFRALFIAVHGYASLLANNAMAWDPAAAEATLTALYGGLTGHGRE